MIDHETAEMSQLLRVIHRDCGGWDALAEYVLLLKRKAHRAGRLEECESIREAMGLGVRDTDELDHEITRLQIELRERKDKILRGED